MNASTNEGGAVEPVTGPRRTRWWRLGQIVLVNVALCAAVCVVIELIFGGWLRSHYLGSLDIPADIDEVRDVGDLVGQPKTIRYTRDRHGIRGTYASLANVDVLTLGGSTTDQRAITNDGTWQELLRSRLAEAGKTVSIINMGIDGQTSYGHILMLDRWAPTVPGLRPRFVLVHVGVNDFYRQGLAHPDHRGWFEKKIQDNSIIIRLVNTFYGMRQVEHEYSLLGHHYEDLAKKQWTSVPRLTHHRELMAERCALYRARLDSLIERIHALGAVPIMVTQRFAVYRRTDTGLVGVDQDFNYEGMSINGVDAYYMMHELNTTLLEACRAGGGICIDLAEELRIEPSDFYDFVHPNDEGTKKVADYLFVNLRSVLHEGPAR